MEQTKNNKNIMIILIAIAIILGGIFYNSSGNKEERFYETKLSEAQKYIADEEWDSALTILDDLDDIKITNKELNDKKEMYESSCVVHKNLKNGAYLQ